MGLSCLSGRLEDIAPNRGSTHLAQTHGKIWPICRYDLHHDDTSAQYSSHVYPALGWPYILDRCLLRAIYANPPPHPNTSVHSVDKLTLALNR